MPRMRSDGGEEMGDGYIRYPDQFDRQNAAIRKHLGEEPDMLRWPGGRRERQLQEVSEKASREGKTVEL
jgi:hypothetical protein